MVIYSIKNIMDNIVDIYNLNNLKIDDDYFTIKIIFEKNKIYSLEINGELQNKNKIDSYYYNSHRFIINLYDIIKDYGYNNKQISIKFKIYNINDSIIDYRSDNIAGISLYDGQIINDCIKKKFQINLQVLFEKITGSIQINIHKIKQSEKIYNNINYEYLEILETFNEHYFLHLDDISYLRIKKYSLCFDEMPIQINKIIKTYELPFISSTSTEGTIEIECYKNCSEYLYYIITKINYNGYIIDFVQNNKCICDEYTMLDYIKTDNKFYNRKKKCRCFINKIYKLLTELNLGTIKIKKNIFEQKLNFCGYISKFLFELTN